MGFASTLSAFRRKSGRSRYRLAQWSGLSEPYIFRLENGQRTGPSRDVVIMIGLALARGDSGRRMSFDMISGYMGVYTGSPREEPAEFRNIR